MKSVKGIRSVSGRKWLANENVWTIPYTIAAIEKLLDAYRDCTIECDQRVSTKMLFIQEKLGQLSAPVKEIPSKLEISQWGSARRTELCDALVARGYSSKTIKAYLSQVERFF